MKGKDGKIGTDRLGVVLELLHQGATARPDHRFGGLYKIGGGTHPDADEGGMLGGVIPGVAVMEGVTFHTDRHRAGKR